MCKSGSDALLVQCQKGQNKGSVSKARARITSLSSGLRYAQPLNSSVKRFSKLVHLMRAKNRTALIILSIFAVLAITSIVYSKLSVTRISMPVSSAWSDGFEVLVLLQGKVIPMHLTRAMNSLKRGGSFLLEESEKDGGNFILSVSSRRLYFQVCL